MTRSGRCAKRDASSSRVSSRRSQWKTFLSPIAGVGFEEATPRPDVVGWPGGRTEDRSKMMREAATTRSRWAPWAARPASRPAANPCVRLGRRRTTPASSRVHGQPGVHPARRGPLRHASQRVADQTRRNQKRTSCRCERGLRDSDLRRRCRRCRRRSLGRTPHSCWSRPSCT